MWQFEEGFETGLTEPAVYLDDLGANTNNIALISDKQIDARIRNREHARNTRKRKKVYLENLERSVREMSARQQDVELERRAHVQMLTAIAERTAARKCTLQKFFEYRGSGELSCEKWGMLLDEACTFILPTTPYRSFDKAEITNNQRVVTGIDGVVADTQSLATLLQSIGRTSTVTARYFAGPEVTYTCATLVYVCRYI